MITIQALVLYLNKANLKRPFHFISKAPLQKWLSKEAHKLFCEYISMFFVENKTALISKLKVFISTQPYSAKVPVLIVDLRVAVIVVREILRLEVGRSHWSSIRVGGCWAGSKNVLR